MAQGKTTKTLVWILMAMLILGLGGFGLTNMGGGLRSIGTVGEKDISIDAYARAIQDELGAIEAQTGQRLTFAQAQEFGIDRAVLSRVVSTRALEAEAASLGISIGDENLKKQILQIEAFKGLDGSFDRESYKFAIGQAGMSEAEFEESIREEVSRSLLQGAIVNGVRMPDAFADAVMTFAGERRYFTWALLKEADLKTAVATPDDAALKAYYDANIADFTLPAAKTITYVWLTPDMILDQVEVDEDALEALYAKREAEFNRPERRLVERLAFADMAAAEAAKAQLDAEETTFEALVEARGLQLLDTDLGDVSAAELGEAGEAVFAVNVGDTAGPVQSDLGPALFRVNGVLPALTTSFEEARDKLREELAADRARRLIDTQVNDIDDLLAGGATLEELANETDMQIAEISYHDGLSDGIAGYEAFRSAAAQITTEDFPQVELLQDGGIFAMRLDDTVDARPAPFDDVRDDVAADWSSAETVKALQEQAAELSEQLKTTDDFASLGLIGNMESDMLRTSFVPQAPQGFMELVFKMQPGDVATIGGNESVALIKLTDIQPPDVSNAELNQLRGALAEELAGSLSQDIFEAFARSVQLRQGVLIDQRAINAVHAQFQ